MGIILNLIVLYFLLERCPKYQIQGWNTYTKSAWNWTHRQGSLLIFYTAREKHFIYNSEGYWNFWDEKFFKLYGLKTLCVCGHLSIIIFTRRKCNSMYSHIKQLPCPPTPTRLCYLTKCLHCKNCTFYCMLHCIL